MFDRIYEYFIAQPSRITVLGRALFGLGSFGLFTGATEHIARVATGQIGRLGGSNGHFSLLSALPAGLPTWWVPETPEGFALYFVLALVGVGIALEGRKFERLFSHY